jgi:hypothetical protein
VADKRITELAPLTAAGTQGDVDVLAIADVSAAETKKITAADVVIAGLEGGVPDGSIPGDKIEIDSIQGDRLVENSITGRELAPDSVDTIHIRDNAVTTEKLADGAVTTEKLADGAVTSDKIADGAIGEAQIADRSIPAIKLVQNTLTAEEIAPEAITSAELASGSVGTDELQDDACSTPKYQNLSVTNEKLADGIDGDKILDGSISGDKLEPGTITGDLITEIGLDKLPDAPPNTFLGGSNGGVSGPPSYRAIVPDDLPAGTASTKGAVSVPASGGLSVDGAGAVGIDNTVVPGGNPFVNYNSHGLITSSRPLSGSDLPPPTLGEVGGVKPGTGLEVTGDGTLNVVPPNGADIGGVKAGDGITIEADGEIKQSLTGVAAGEYTKVTCDTMGNITAGTTLEASDIPNIDWNQIDNIVIDGTEIENKSINMRHLNHYSIAKIQEDKPPVTLPELHAGCLWFQESTSTLYMFNNNSWFPVGIGRLSAENLRYCGLFDPSTALITATTQFGAGEGFNSGDPIPDPSDELTGIYFVAETAGNAVNKHNVVGVSFDGGDWIVCNGAATGWSRIDTMVGGSGSGSDKLEDLLDVNVTGKQEGALLQYQSDGKWHDIYALDAGTY